MIRYFNGNVLTMDGGMEIAPLEVWTEGDAIAYVGPAREDMPAFERQVDLRGDLLMPGFKNAHAHSAMTFLRSYADDLPLQSWLFDKVFPLEARLIPDDVYALTKLAVLEYLAGGITSAFDMYFHRDAFAAAAKECGFRMVICGALGVEGDWNVARDDCEKFNAMGPLISYVPGIHAEYTANTALLSFMKELVDQYKKPFFAHISETKKEVDECVARHGVTPAVLFEKYGLYEHGGGGFHCVWFTPEDMEIYARRKLWAVTCPASNAKLASGIAPITELQRRGIPLAIGTDGPASNNALSMFREMYLLTVLQKLREQDAAACDAAPVLRMACSGGAGAMGVDADCLRPGKLADMTVIDLHRANMLPVHNTVKNLVYAGSDANVRMTVVGGRILYEDGQFFVGESAEDICRRAQAATERILSAE